MCSGTRSAVFLSALVAALLSMLQAVSAHAQMLTVLYDFPETGEPFGAGPATGLTPDSMGNLFTTTMNGGVYQNGTVVKLSPNGSGGWSGTTLYAFRGGADGSIPSYGPLIFDKAGNLYGTTIYGGAHQAGVVYKLSPSGGGWKETVLYDFPGGNHNSYPASGVIMNRAGNLFGTTFYTQGGTSLGGGVFELTKSSGGWAEKLIYTYALGNDAGLMSDAQGDIFGIGSSGSDPTVFELKPNGTGGGWTSRVIYKFSRSARNANPNGTLARDTEGNLYGTTQGNGTGGVGGTVYKLALLSSGPNKGEYVYHLLYSFTDSTDGSQPAAGVVLAGSTIYGTTYYGGANGLGTVFELTGSGYEYQERVLWSFDGANGISADDRLLLKAGNLYGTTAYGGSYNLGVAFELKP
jgi:uncharacterized repeat protein (TIGR03803 family)